MPFGGILSIEELPGFGVSKLVARHWLFPARQKNP